MKIAFYKSVLALILLLSSVGFAAAQDEREKGIQFYKQGDFASAIKSLKKATKNDSANAEGWYYLGLSHLKKNDTKNSIKALRKAVELKPDDADYRVGLAYAYVLKNNLPEAGQEARKSLELNAKNAEAHYVLGVVSFRDEIYNSAYDSADRAIKLNSNFAAAYLLKSESLTSSFARQAGTVVKEPNSKTELLEEASENLEKYLSLSAASETSNFYREYLDSLKFFAQYYKLPENQFPKSPDALPAVDADVKPLNIVSKPRSEYTDAARGAMVSGVVRLLVGFSATGNVKYILVIKPLSHGLNEEAVRAARGIRFEPAVKDGKPISVVKQIEYSFSIY